VALTTPGTDRRGRLSIDQVCGDSCRGPWNGRNVAIGRCRDRLRRLVRGIQGVRRALPDVRLEIVDTIVEEDRVCFLLAGEGTHQGQLGPIPGSGKHVTWDVVDVCRFRDGRIAEHWGVPDRMGIIEQVGMPQPPGWLMKLMMKRKS